MKKKLVTALICTFLAMQAIPVWAATHVESVGQVKLLRKGTIINDEFEAPKLKISLTHMKEYERKKVKIVLKLQGAVWASRTGGNIACSEVKRVSVTDIGVRDMGEDGVEFQVQIPFDIKDDEEISFTVPLFIEMMNDEASVTINTLDGDRRNIEEEQKLFISASENKLLKCEVEDSVPFFRKETGIMAPIAFKEVYPASLNSQQTMISVTILNEDVDFDEIEYLSKQENTVDTDYIIDGSKYAEYLEGFSGMNKDIKMKIRNDSPKTRFFTLSGQPPLDAGKIVLKNLPVKLVNPASEEELMVSVKGEGLMESGKKLCTGILLPKEETEAPIVEESTQDNIENNTEESINEKQTTVEFTLGKGGYVKDGEWIETSDKPFIQGTGSIMVPIKAVAIALGVEENQITYKDSVATIDYKGKTIKLTKGSTIAKVDEEEKQLGVPAMIYEGKMYVPVGKIAQLLEVEVQWDGTTKTAIFRNEV